MSDIPTRRPPFPVNPAVTLRPHPHTSERVGDAGVPVYWLKHRHDDEETPVTRPPETSEEIRAALGEHPPAVDYGVRALRAATDAGLLRQAGLDGDLAVGLATAHAQENSLVALDAREEGRIQGERAGKVAGLDIAKQMTDEMKAEIKASGDGWDEYLVSVLDDLAVRFIERSAKEGSR